jgi:hypothetical protein
VRYANPAVMHNGMGGVDARVWSAINAPASRPSSQRTAVCNFDGIKLTHKAVVRPQGLRGGSTG